MHNYRRSTTIDIAHKLRLLDIEIEKEEGDPNPNLQDDHAALSQLEEFLTHTYSLEPWFDNDIALLTAVKKETEKNLTTWRKRIMKDLASSQHISSHAIAMYDKYVRVTRFYILYCDTWLKNVVRMVDNDLPFKDVPEKIIPATPIACQFEPVKQIAPPKDLGTVPKTITF